MKRSSEEISSSSRRVRLLLHAVDGCVPYLTPTTLERYFPPSDDLWIGMAVRNTSVVPCFDDSKSGKQRKERDPRDPPKVQDSKKPRGYTFDALEPDPWLLPYTRVTVPSFDLLHDDEMRQFKSENSNTNKQISVWTPHGRQKLSPEAYAKAASGLNSQFTLSLCDMNEDGTSKRKEKAETRNKQWFADILERRSQTTKLESLWSPVLIPSKDEPIPQTVSLAHVNEGDVAGVALVGRWRDGLGDILKFPDIKHIAVLCTHSFAEIVEIASGGAVDVIGTYLPTRLAQNKLALGIDVPEIDAIKRVKSSESKTEKSLDDEGCISMNDEKYALDTRPLVPGCTCLACNNNEFSKAYIHHLVRSKELLAEILLFGHNLHHLLVWIRTYNATEDKGTFVSATITQFK